MPRRVLPNDSFSQFGGKMLQLDEIRSQLPALKEQIAEVGGYL
jgi:hypothetical protein